MTAIAAVPLPTTASEMCKLLHRHYLPDEAKPAGIFAPEIQAPGPTLRKADLIWLGCTAAAGSELVGHEIKVSRADILTELADLTKSDPWQRYCDRWWLVIPSPSLINDLTLPESWGVLTPPSGRRTRSMTVYRLAPALKPAEQSPALRTVAAWLHWRLRDQRNRAEDARASETRVANELRELRTYAARPRDDGRDIVSRIVAKLGGQQGDRVGDWQYQVEIDEVVAAIKDLGVTYARRDEAIRTLESTRSALEAWQRSITRLLGEMDKDSIAGVTL